MHRYRALQAATLEFTEHGVPYSSGFADVYHSSAGAIGQAQHVFLAGNDLPQRWMQRSVFTILETGFGLGLNFLTTWSEWRQTRSAGQRLHFISVEKYPFRKEDLAQLYGLWPEYATLANELLEQWPWLTPGFHRLQLDGGSVTLTLIFGDALEELPQLEAEVDAFYLDGFAPSKNPELWSDKLFRQIGRLSRPDATCATYTVAGVVRQGLQHAGFALEKRPGYAGKREMLSGRFSRAKTRSRLHTSPYQSKKAVIIGAGIAGSSIAHRLAERDWSVTVIDRREGPGQESSGNKAGILLPVLSVDDNLQSRLSRACFAYALRHLRALPETFAWGQPGVLHIAKNADEEARMRAAIDALEFPPEFAHFVSREETPTFSGHALAAGGWRFPAGAWVHPPGVCAANLGHPAIKTLYRTTVESLRKTDQGWQLFDAGGALIDESEVVILANAFEASRWAPQLPLSRERRQVSLIPAAQLPELKTIVCGDGYLTPAVEGYACLGASRDEDAIDLQPTEHGHLRNLQKLKALLPAWEGNLQAGQLHGRAAYRPGSPDRLPLVGALPDFDAATSGSICQLYQIPRQTGLFGLLGFGARGLTWAPLLAEWLAAHLNGEPSPLEKELADAIDPARFWLRQLRRGP